MIIKCETCGIILGTISKNPSGEYPTFTCECDENAVIVLVDE